ncbi:MAG: hypothetical protein Fur006_13060 [Coleofasciculaceae cyanobacterium]
MKFRCDALGLKFSYLEVKMIPINELSASSIDGFQKNSATMIETIVTAARCVFVAIVAIPVIIFIEVLGAFVQPKTTLLHRLNHELFEAIDD